MTGRQLMTALALGCYAGGAFAAAAGGGGLAWEAPLTTITDSFTGPVAFAVSSIAVVLSLATLAFADNLSGAGRQLVYLVLIIAALIGVVNLLQTLFEGGAALGDSATGLYLIVGGVLLVTGVALARLQLALFDRLRRARARRLSEQA